jgi:hypothetical protein
MKPKDKKKVAPCHRCKRLAHSGRMTWMVEDTIWKWAGFDDDEILCVRCFHTHVLTKLGRDNPGDITKNIGDLFKTLAEAVLAGELPVANEVATFTFEHYGNHVLNMRLPVNEAGDEFALTVVLGSVIRTYETYIFGLSGEDKELTGIRFGASRWEGDHMTLEAPKHSEIEEGL